MVGAAHLWDLRPHEDKEVAEDLQHLVIVIIESHLHIEANELRHMPASERLLGPENRPNLSTWKQR